MCENRKISWRAVVSTTSTLRHAIFKGNRQPNTESSELEVDDDKDDVDDDDADDEDEDDAGPGSSNLSLEELFLDIVTMVRSSLSLKCFLSSVENADPKALEESR